MQLTRNSHCRFELSDRRRLTFYAAVFSTPTLITEQDTHGKLVKYREAILPGAFTDALASNAEVIADINHDAKQEFACRSDGSLLLQEDPYGLFASCWIPETPFGEDVLSRVKSGDLNACSFRFAPVTSSTENDIVNRVAVKLFDVCLTNRPAYPGTDVHLRTANNMAFQSARYRYLKMKIKSINNKLANNTGVI